MISIVLKWAYEFYNFRLFIHGLLLQTELEFSRTQFFIKLNIFLKICLILTTLFSCSVVSSSRSQDNLMWKYSMFWSLMFKSLCFGTPNLLYANFLNCLYSFFTHFLLILISVDVLKFNYFCMPLLRNITMQIEISEK